jgi:hypothetical protein
MAQEDINKSILTKLDNGEELSREEEIKMVMQFFGCTQEYAERVVDGSFGIQEEGDETIMSD